ncbi:MAG: DUF218 domain-containing protein [Phyllobacteriaceae bacterium]|nr:DUF218 domain-containing protein [Phyllobacteriaceae bacterium]
MKERTRDLLRALCALSPRHVAGQILRGAVLATVVGSLLFGLGFVVFAFVVTSSEEPADPHADAIVALTGGRDRVMEAIELLTAGRGRRLLISGVHPLTRAADIQKLTETDRDMFACCIDLGRTALSTAGNAEEAAAWVKQHGYKSLIVVTSAYHMPRSLVELDRALPNVRKVPFAVSHPDLNLETWYLHPTTAKLLFGEYLKYIVARFAHQTPRIASTQMARLGGVTAR